MPQKDPCQKQACEIQKCLQGSMLNAFLYFSTLSVNQLQETSFSFYQQMIWAPLKSSISVIILKIFLIVSTKMQKIQSDMIQASCLRSWLYVRIFKLH